MLKYFCNQQEWQQDKLVLLLLCFCFWGFLGVFLDPIQMGKSGENSDEETLQILC